MIIVVRGTNGSGKSTAVRNLFKFSTSGGGFGEQSEVLELKGVKRPVLVIGPYIDGRSMGGCDCIRQPRKIYEMIASAIDNKWHVVLEGVVLAESPYRHYHGDGHDVRMALMNPPMRVCLERIAHRQKLKGHKSGISLPAMKAKRRRASIAFEKAQYEGMITATFEDAREATHWILRQLRSP